MLRDCSQGSEASSTAAATDSRLLFLAEFLEARIIPKRIEHRIEPEQRGSERQNLSEKPSLYCFGANEAAIFSKRGSPRSESHSGRSLRKP